MGGPIIRSGASPKFSENWDNIFGKKTAGKKPAATKSDGKQPAAAATKKSAKKKAAPAAKKPVKTAKKK